MVTTSRKSKARRTGTGKAPSAKGAKAKPAKAAGKARPKKARSASPAKAGSAEGSERTAAAAAKPKPEPAPSQPAAKPRVGKTKVSPPPQDLEVDPEVLAFIRAIEDYRRQNERPFPTWSEVLMVVKKLGYRLP